ncbi:MAG: hypothetical protein U0794_14025 [Isosphaeraceae bacterium]
MSGFDINGLRVSYSAADDVLSIGIEQPLSQQPGQPGPVIAGDADNNGNDGTVNPAVLVESPTFQDYPDFGGSEYMGAFLDLDGDGYADILAGYSINDARSPKQYQVAEAIVNTNAPPTTLPDFGTPLPQYTGNIYKLNSPAHPNLEFAINDFSKLYLAETGQPLSSNTNISLGAFGGSAEDAGIGEAYFPQQTFNLGQATVPPVTPPECPPVSPPILVNYHEDNHINTAHPTNVRVSIFGSSGFDVTKIDPSTVTLGGAHPVFGFDRFINGDEWLDTTFVFKGNEIDLPAGWTQATVTGELTNGTTFESSVRVFNRDESYYSDSEMAAARQRQLNQQTRDNGWVNVDPNAAATDLALASMPSLSGEAYTAGSNLYETAIAAKAKADKVQAAAQPTVSIKRRDPVVVAQGEADRVSPRLQASINRMVRDMGAVDVTQVSLPQPTQVPTRLQASIDRMVRDMGAVDVSDLYSSR